MIRNICYSNARNYLALPGGAETESRKRETAPRRAK
jgi:hypothetical protein